MVMNFGLAAGVMYATRKSKLPFKEKLRKSYEERVLQPRSLVLYDVPYFKIVLVLVLVGVQVWVHGVIQRHKQELVDHGMLTQHNSTISVTETSGVSAGAAKTLMIEEIVGHIALSIVCFVQIILVKIQRLKITQQQIELRIYSLYKMSRVTFKLTNIRDIRVIKKGRDRISHKTQKLSVRVYASAGENKTAFFDFYETISVKVAKMTYVRVIAALRISYDDTKANSVVHE